MLYVRYVIFIGILFSIVGMIENKVLNMETHYFPFLLKLNGEMRNKMEKSCLFVENNTSRPL